MSTRLKRARATKIIEEHFKCISNEIEVLVSAREAGRKMVEIYRLLTGDMPQAVGIDVEYRGDELPGVEFATPMERSAQRVTAVHPGFGDEPDILIEGDQDDDDEKLLEEGQKLLRSPDNKGDS